MRRSNVVPLLAVAVLAACQPRQGNESSPPSQGTDTPQSPPGQQQPPDSLAAVRAAMLSAIGDAPCARSEQCRAVPVGAKPCGGPRGYLAYSVTTTDSARLATIVGEYTRLDAENNRRTGAISDCSITPRPPVACTAGRCVLSR